MAERCPSLVTRALPAALFFAPIAWAGVAHADPPAEVRIAPSANGALGAWLVAGPWRAQKPALDTIPAGVDESALKPSNAGALGGERDLGDKKGKRPAATWTLASSNDGPIDLKAALDTKDSEVVAYAMGRLHVANAGKMLLLLGVDDGVRVSVDGRVVYTRDEYRPYRDDDDVIPLDLAEGDHDVVLKLHQRDGAWLFRARITDAYLGPVSGAYVTLPGTTAEDARALASKMSWISFDRAFDPNTERYRPKLVVKFLEGIPLGVPLTVTARAEGLFDLAAGGVPAGGEISITVPPFAPPDRALDVDVNVAGRALTVQLPSRPASEKALVRASRALAATPEETSWLAPGSLDSVKHLARRLGRLVARGDADTEAQTEEAKELDRLAAALEKKTDPYAARSGPMRRAIRSPIDGEPSEVGVYVPLSYRAGSARKYPLIVGLHGLNGYPMAMMRWLFGFDDPKREQPWEDRHLGPLPPIDAFVITPNGHGNAMYRELGEDDVVRAVEWAMKTYPIDAARVTITGPSMGGIGSAAIPFHRPHVFAGAAPLCGYHSQLIRRDVAGRPMRPWEKFLAEDRSNVLWAENGEHLPLYIVHGTKDLPEENSGVLIERYEKLGYAVKHEHPESGHNVWQETYEDLKGIKWLLNRRLDLHPRHVRFKTSRTRWGTSAWLTVNELAGEAAWAEVDARVASRKRVSVRAGGVAEIAIAKDPALLDPAAPITVTADGAALVFDAEEPIVLHREGTVWKKGAADHATPVKRGTVTGPLRDVFHEPILFVWAAGDEGRANEHVARAFSRVRPGVTVSYPIMSDQEFIERGEPLANDRALFLVGRSNKVLAALEAAAPFPIRVADGSVTVGDAKMTGRELGAAFIRPNPMRSDRYVVVVAGADVPGTLRSLSLPDLVPDFVVWDEALGPSRGQILVGAGSLRAGGMFGKDWSLPKKIADPLARAPRPGAKSEYDATPYLP